MEPGSPEYWIITRAMLENFSLDAKDELLGLVKGRIESAMNPQPPQPTIDEQIKMKTQELNEMKVQAQIQKDQMMLQLKAEEVDAEAARDRGEAQWSESTAVKNIQTMDAQITKLLAEADEKEAAAVKHLADARAARTANA